MDKTIIVAIIAACATAAAALITSVVSLITARASRRAAEKLEVQKAELEQTSAEQNARRDYEYDARKRLYAEIEPLFFQLFEALEEAHYRVRSLARSSRKGNLPAWLASPVYYLRSSVYKLILPAVFLRLIQRQMTFVDLRVDRTIRTRYQLLKLYSRSFTDDFDYALLNPQLQYDPNHPNPQWQQLVKQAPQIYARQGLTVGTLESVCDAMIITDTTGRARAMFFSEFDNLVFNPQRNPSVDEALSLLTRFSPTQLPVLARLLVVQAVMSQLILSTYGAEITVPGLKNQLKAIVNSKTLNRALEWQRGTPNPDLPLALQYWDERLTWLTAEHSWIELDG